MTRLLILMCTAFMAGCADSPTATDREYDPQPAALTVSDPVASTCDVPGCLPGFGDVAPAPAPAQCEIVAVEQTLFFDRDGNEVTEAQYNRLPSLFRGETRTELVEEHPSMEGCEPLRKVDSIQIHPGTNNGIAEVEVWVKREGGVTEQFSLLGATASSNNDSAANAIDGDLTTAWNQDGTEGIDAELSLDLFGSGFVERVVITLTERIDDSQNVYLVVFLDGSGSSAFDLIEDTDQTVFEFSIEDATDQ